MPKPIPPNSRRDENRDDRIEWSLDTNLPDYVGHPEVEMMRYHHGHIRRVEPEATISWLEHLNAAHGMRSPHWGVRTATDNDIDGVFRMTFSTDRSVLIDGLRIIETVNRDGDHYTNTWLCASVRERNERIESFRRQWDYLWELRDA